jgi:hypothetical protein
MRKKLMFLALVVGVVILLAPAAAYANGSTQGWGDGGVQTYLGFHYNQDRVSLTLVWDQPTSWTFEVTVSDTSWVITKATWVVQGHGVQKNGAQFDGVTTLLNAKPTLRHQYSSTKYNAIWINTQPPVLAYWSTKVTVTGTHSGHAFTTILHSGKLSQGSLIWSN